MPEQEKHGKHAPQCQCECGKRAEKPERREKEQFLPKGEGITRTHEVGGPGGEETMPIGTPLRSIKPDKDEEFEEGD